MPATGGARRLAGREKERIITTLRSKAERAVLGGILQHPERIPEVLTLIKPQDMDTDRHRKIFDGLVEGYNAGEVVDELSGANYLLEKGALDDADDAVAVTSLVSEAPLQVSLMLHVEQVADNAARRRIAAGTTRLSQAYREGMSVETLTELAQEIVDSATAVSDQDMRRIGHTIDDLLETISMRADGAAEDRIETGFPDLDHTLNGGLKPGQLAIVAARPGVGKSTLALDIMRHMSITHNQPSLLFSLEMTEDEVQERALSAEAQVPINQLKTGHVPQDGWERIKVAREKFSDAPLWVDDSPELTMLDITAKAKLAVRQHGIRMIAVDYLQLLRSGSKEESRQQEVSNFSRSLKLLAKSCQVPVVAIAQLNREVAKRGDDALPKASDLRESGSLEQDADVIVLINRPDAESRDHERAGEADLIVAKNRGGATGTVTVAQQLHYSRFTPMA